MRFRTLEIRWHDSKPISTCDFQPLTFKKARPPPGQEKNYATQAYRLATGGEDNHVRIWMVHPHLRPPAVVAESDPTSAANAPRPPRVEYLATLSRHSAAVNVVRFSPNGELVASAGDDGMIIIWAPSSSPQAATYGSDLSPEDLQHEKEYWKPRTTFRCTTMQVYDLAWSPSGEYIIAGSTDNTARVFASVDGKCVYEIAEHLHYVQGVAWDPLNEYIATQSSDRSMHIYRISTKPGGAFEAHAVGKNTRMPHRHSHSHSHSQTRTPSAHGGGRPRFSRRASTTSDAESSSAFALDLAEDAQSTTSGAPLTPAMSVSSTPAFMFPPPPIEGSSRRSSFSSNAPGSPSPFNQSSASGASGAAGNNSRYGRSPSPMPPLPAIRSLPSPSQAASTALWTNVKLYGDESYTNFFRRLTFSPDGGLLLTPAGQFEDPSVVPSSTPGSASFSNENSTPMRGRKGHPSEATPPAPTSTPGSSSSVYIYSRANFARPPIAQLPGHKKASVAVRFSPILYELRPAVALPGSASSEHSAGKSFVKDSKPPSAVLELGVDGSMDIDVVGPLPQGVEGQPAAAGTASSASSGTPLTPQRTPAVHPTTIATPTPRPAISTTGVAAAEPMASPVDLRPPTPAASKPSTPAHTAQTHSQGQLQSQTQTQSQSQSQSQSQVQSQVQGYSHSQGHGQIQSAVQTGSVFALPYRMLFAVVTMDAVAIYDTQQATPLCLLTKLHYDEFTDMTWSPDGQTLILSSRDGYCTLVVFDDILPAYHTQQHTMQLHSIAHNNYVPLSYPSSSSTIHGSTASAQATPTVTPSLTSVALPFAGTATNANTSTPRVNPKKRHEPPLTPAASVDGGTSDGASYFAEAQAAAGSGSGSGSGSLAGMSGVEVSGSGEDKMEPPPPVVQEPPKKKRRVALTRVGDLEP